MQSQIEEGAKSTQVPGRRMEGPAPDARDSRARPAPLLRYSPPREASGLQSRAFHGNGQIHGPQRLAGLQSPAFHANRQICVVTVVHTVAISVVSSVVPA